MFNTLDDVRKAIHEFRGKHFGKYPNVVFISREKRKYFLELLYNSYSVEVYPSVRDYFGDLLICGIRVRWTESIDGVDYLEEFDDISKELENIRQQKEYFNKVLKPLIKVKSNKRKIIL